MTPSARIAAASSTSRCGPSSSSAAAASEARAGTRTSPSSPRVQVTRVTWAPSATYLAMVTPVPIDSSSGWAWTSSSRRGDGCVRGLRSWPRAYGGLAGSGHDAPRLQRRLVPAPFGTHRTLHLRCPGRSSRPPTARGGFLRSASGTQRATSLWVLDVAPRRSGWLSTRPSCSPAGTRTCRPRSGPGASGCARAAPGSPPTPRQGGPAGCVRPVVPAVRRRPDRDGPQPGAGRSSCRLPARSSTRGRPPTGASSPTPRRRPAHRARSVPRRRAAPLPSPTGPT